MQPAIASELAPTVHRIPKSPTNLAHAGIGQASEPSDKDADGDALDGIEVDYAVAGDRVFAGLRETSLASVE